VTSPEVRVQISEDGSIFLPPEVREFLQVDIGDEIIIDYRGDGIFMTSERRRRADLKGKRRRENLRSRD
jgi:bifunctional DNA-binding transcriptional regulator/antitoxin component of YhaV-PrlF toxin-antitoxin module